MPWLGCRLNPMTGWHIPMKDDPLRCSRCGERRQSVDDDEVRRARRNSDPEASHLAAEEIVNSGTAATLRAQVLQAVRKWPGRTAGELGDLSGLGYDRVWRRVSELEQLGLVYRADEMRRWRNGKSQHLIHPCGP